MPTYVYKFVETGETIEIQQAFSDDALTEAVHPASGATMQVKKVFQPVGVTFKGGGFYKTDSRGSSSKSGSSSSSDWSSVRIPIACPITIEFTSWYVFPSRMSTRTVWGIQSPRSSTRRRTIRGICSMIFVSISGKASPIFCMFSCEVRKSIVSRKRSPILPRFWNRHCAQYRTLPILYVPTWVNTYGFATTCIR